MRVLMIDDDPDLCELVADALSDEGYTVDICHEGDDGLRWLRERAHDLVLLDRMLPQMSGTSLLRKARSEGIATPVLMVTALGTVEDLVEGLDGGADDYIVKPFAVQELLARIRAMNRRPRAWDASREVQHGSLRLDPMNKMLYNGAHSVSLSKRESDLLEILLRGAGKTLPRSTLLSHVWGPDAPVEEGNLDNYIYFIRRRLRAVESPLQIVTIRHVGYCLRDGEDTNGV